MFFSQPLFAPTIQPQVIEDLKRQVELFGRNDSQLPQLHDPLEQARARAAKKRDAGAHHPLAFDVAAACLFANKFFR